MYQTEPTADLLTEQFIPVYGTFGERFLAALIDSLILAIPNLICQYLLGIPFLGLVVDWLYFAYMESGSNQATIGKKVMGLKVTNLAGEKITFAQATGRYFGKLVSAIILFIGYLMMLWDDKKQTLHDKMAGTLVVKIK
jgi:uncharacterized RDD family membrane protein YckC